jgi:hypothetical protein
MQLMLHVRPDAARMLRRHRPDSVGSLDLLSRARKLGVTLRPLRTRSEDSVLASGFTVEVPDRATAERVAEELRDCDVVESAYFVPAEELP